jgi:hypothetical protein
MRCSNRIILFFLTFFLATALLSFVTSPISATDPIIIEPSGSGSLPAQTQAVQVEQAYLKASNPGQLVGQLA